MCGKILLFTTYTFICPYTSIRNPRVLTLDQLILYCFLPQKSVLAVNKHTLGHLVISLQINTKKFLSPYRDYECLCAPGFYGKNCDAVIDACYGNPCTNDAKCEVVEAGRFS